MVTRTGCRVEVAVLSEETCSCDSMEGILEGVKHGARLAACDEFGGPGIEALDEGGELTFVGDEEATVLRVEKDLRELGDKGVD